MFSVHIARSALRLACPYEVDERETRDAAVWQARGPTIFSDWQVYIKNSIYLTPEGDRKANYYNTWKDVVIPGLEADEQFWGEVRVEHTTRRRLVT